MTTVSYSHLHTGLASAEFPAEGAAWVVGEWCVFVDESLARWEVYVDAVNRRVFVNTDTWESFDGHAIVAFQNEFIHAYEMKEVTELRFIVTDGGPFADAARKQAARDGSDVVRAKDRITELQERAGALVVQAASLNRVPSEVQLQAFAVRHARLTEDMAVLERDMIRLRGMLGLASTALVDASTG